MLTLVAVNTAFSVKCPAPEQDISTVVVVAKVAASAKETDT